MFNPSQFPFLDPILELTNTEKVSPPLWRNRTASMKRHSCINVKGSIMTYTAFHLTTLQ